MRGGEPHRAQSKLLSWNQETSDVLFQKCDVVEVWSFLPMNHELAVKVTLQDCRTAKLLTAVRPL